MKKSWLLILLLLVPDPNFLKAQTRVHEDWVARYHGPDTKTNTGKAIAVDFNGNAYVTGISLSASGDYSVTVKYDRDGNQIWVARHKGATYGIALDLKGNIYVTGTTARTDHGDFLTIKFDPAGREMWVATFNGPGNGHDSAVGVALDPMGNVYVTGSSWGDNRSDYATIKYDPDGKRVWVARYHGPNTWGLDGAVAVALDSVGNVYVTGTSGYSNISAFATIKYSPGGNELWVARYDGPENGVYRARSIALNTDGDLYVTGTSGVPYRFGIKDEDYVTIKYDRSGNEVWVARYNGPGNGNDEANAIAIDDKGNAYVTGASFGIGTGEYATVKYDRDGNQVWVVTFNGPANGSNQARALALDAQGNVYVTGSSDRDSTWLNRDYATVKYDRDGNEVWVARYNGPGNGGDVPSALALDSVGNVYVTGTSLHDSLGNYHVATIKYSQSPGPPFVSALFFPRLVTEPNESTGIAVVNLDTAPASLRFTAFDVDGSAVAGSDITNPADRTLNAGSQIPILDADVFGDGLMSMQPVGWLKVESTVQKIAGFFLTLNPALTFLDGADVSSRTMTSFVFPELETGSEVFTQIHIANPSSRSSQIILELVAADGTVRARTDRTIQANGTIADMLSNLFPGALASSSDYLRVTASQGVVPFELLGRTGRHVRGINGQDTSSGATTLYSPQYVVGGSTWRTTLSVMNLDDTGGTVRFRLVGDDGVMISTRELPIAARGKLFITGQDFFLSPTNQKQGYVEITSSGPRLTGSVVFGDHNDQIFSTALPLVTNLQKEMIFGQVASAEGSAPSWFTGLALLNATPIDANVRVEVFDENGAVVMSGNFVIPPRSRLSQLLTQYFPDLVGRNILKGYIRVTTDRPVASFALFGTTNLSVLSAIPPQLVP